MEKKWENEPNYEEFVSNNLVCFIKRHPTLMSLCGYVGVDREHPLFGVHYDDTPDLYVHGGLTFSGNFPDKEEWFFGFDCGHAGDYVPGLFVAYEQLGLPTEQFIVPGDTYRDIDYVREEVKDLAKQLSNRLEFLYYTKK